MALLDREKEKEEAVVGQWQAYFFWPVISVKSRFLRFLS
jgi:hypothetical protein